MCASPEAHGVSNVYVDRKQHYFNEAAVTDVATAAVNVYVKPCHVQLVRSFFLCSSGT